MERQNSPWWPPTWPPWASPTPHSVESEHRITTLEIHKEDQEEANKAFTGRLMWLERGLQGCISILIMLLFWSAPNKASVLADVLIGLLRRGGG